MSVVQHRDLVERLTRIEAKLDAMPATLSEQAGPSLAELEQKIDALSEAVATALDNCSATIDKAVDTIERTNTAVLEAITAPPPAKKGKK